MWQCHMSFKLLHALLAPVSVISFQLEEVQEKAARIIDGMENVSAERRLE